MKVLNDFSCTKCGTVKEYFVDNQAKAVECQDCGGEATKKQAVIRFKLPGNDPSGFPTAYDQWAKKREQKLAEEKRQATSE
jgi:hypothetical protein